MAPTVQTYMIPRLVYLREGDRLQVALRPLLDLGITAVPVLDEDHKPVGIISLRDLVDKRGGPPHMREDVRTVLVTASIQDAGKMLVDASLHHLVVVDAAVTTAVCADCAGDEKPAPFEAVTDTRTVCPTSAATSR